jgi:hypothetical protein
MIWIQRSQGKGELSHRRLGFRRGLPARAALVGDAGDVAGAPGGDGEDDEVHLDAGKMMAPSTCSIASLRECRA